MPDNKESPKKGTPSPPMDRLNQHASGQTTGVASAQFGKKNRRKTDPARKIGNVKVIDGLADKHAVGNVAAGFVQRLLHQHRLRRSLRGHQPVIAFPTGSTPKPMYERLRAMHTLNWRGAHVFHLDEYVPQRGGEVRPDLTYRYEMNKNLWNAPQLDRTVKHYMGDYILEPEKYEQQLNNLGGADLVILGIGANGHLAFNEPGASPESTTRYEDLTAATLKSNFGVDSVAEAKAKGLPTRAATMGLKPILNAKKVILLANKGKEEIVRKALTGPVTPDVPASFLQNHPDVTVIADFTI